MTNAGIVDARRERIRLAHGRAAVELAPAVGGRVAAFELDGWDLLRRDGWTDNEWGAFVMAPWAGRLRGARVAWRGRAWAVPATQPPHALHGLVSNVPWTVLDREARSVRLERPLGPAWPTGGRIVHDISLHEDRLALRLELHAEREATPGIIGWHPWFRRRASHTLSLEAGPAVETGEVEILLAARRRAEMDADGLPTGRLVAPCPDPLDDVLLDVTGAPVVRWAGGPALELRSPGAAAWIVYTGHPDGVCVEPVTGLPDGLNGGLLGDPQVATPGHPVVASFELAWG